MFHRYRRGFAKQLGKVIMHAGSHGQGCHYLMFDYMLGALASRELPEKERQAARGWLLELVLDARCKGGGFSDTPLNGWDYGTAMALLAFRALEPRRKPARKEGR